MKQPGDINRLTLTSASIIMIEVPGGSSTMSIKKVLVPYLMGMVSPAVRQAYDRSAVSRLQDGEVLINTIAKRW